MTFEERLAELGVDLSDLPKPNKLSFAYNVDNPVLLRNVSEAVYEFELNTATGGRAYIDYILHLTDIIDRMETRIVNLTGERDWLNEYYGVNDGIGSCSMCIHSAEPYDSAICVECNYSDLCQFERADVPEDWRADDA